MALGGFRLRVSKGADHGKELLFESTPGEPVALGRGVEGEKDFRCSDAKVSRRHAVIEASERNYLLKDLSSTNRTRINGRLIKPDIGVPLGNGDEIMLGPDTVVKFELLQVEAAKSEAPGQAKAAKEEFRNYAVYENLATTEMDRVDAAVDTRSGVRVALKRFDGTQVSKPVRKRILDQAARARRWQHPNIAAVIDAGEQGDVVYVATRLVDGVTLLTVQERCIKEVEPALAVYLVREVCAGLAYAQKEEPGFVHRNMGPWDIMVGYTGEVVMIDFGFTPIKAMQEGTVRMSRNRVHYLAPEHRAQRGLEPRSDIFSIGTVLYELLTQEAIDPHRMTGPTDIQTVKADLPPDLAALTMRSLARRPEDRFGTAAEMEGALTAVLQAMAPGYGAPEVTAWMIRMRLGFWK